MCYLDLISILQPYHWYNILQTKIALTKFTFYKVHCKQITCNIVYIEDFQKKSTLHITYVLLFTVLSLADEYKKGKNKIPVFKIINIS